MNRRAKGNKAEREAVDLYNQAGFRACRISETAGGYSFSDAFGLYDIIAMIPGRRIRFAQVKSNTGSGVREFVEQSDMILPAEHAVAENLIRHDGAGGRPVAWRLQQSHGEGGSYRTVIDERKDDVPASGEAVVAFLRGEE